MVRISNVPVKRRKYWLTTALATIMNENNFSYTNNLDVAHRLKLVSAIFYEIFIFSPNDSPSKTMENVFYFI